MNNKNYEIITKKSNECKFIIFNIGFNGITLKDFIIILLLQAINIIVSIFLFKISFWIGIINFIILFSFSFLILINVKNENMKLYEYLKIKLIYFILDKNKIKYKQLNENCIIKKIDKNKIYFKNNVYANVYEIISSDIDDNDENEIFTKINILKNFCNKISLLDYDLIKVELPIENNINFINNKNKFTENYNNNLKNINNITNNYKSSYFLIIKSYDNNRLELICNSLFKNNIEDFQIKIPKDYIVDYLISYLTFSNFNFDLLINKESIKINKTYYALRSISKFPSQIFPSWGKLFFNLKNIDVVLKKYSISHNEAIKRIDLSVQRAQALENTKLSKQIEKNYFIDDFINLQSKIKLNDENINLIEIFFIIKANSLKELNEKNMELESLLINNNFLLKNHKYQQRQLINNLMISKKKSFYEAQEISNSALAYIWPFENKTLSDENGFLIGKNYQNNEPVFFNIKTRNDRRTNSNTLIIGKTGSGKTYNAKNLIFWNVLNNIKTFIIDPEMEYEKLFVDNKDIIVNVIDFRKNFINPLRCFSINLILHINFFEQFIKINFPNITFIELFILQKALKDLYKSFKIDDKNISQILIWPTIVDLYELLKTNKYKKNNLQFYIEKLIDNELWNNDTNIIDQSILTIFNIHNISSNKNIKEAQLFLLINWIDEKIKQNKYINNKYNKDNWISIVIDEAHLLLNSYNKITLNYISNLTKRIRKYNGILILITQNINDLIGNDEIKKETTAILNNLEYIFIHNLLTNDLNNFNNFLKIKKPLTLYQKNFLLNAKVGECILLCNNKFNYLKIINPFI